VLAGGITVGCSGADDGPFEMGWGLECANDRFSAVALESAESGLYATPEAAVDQFLDPERPVGVSSELPGERLPDDGWERADFVPTQGGTVPVTATVTVGDDALPLPQLAFVHRDGGRIDAVLLLRSGVDGWVVDAVHACAT